MTVAELIDRIIAAYPGASGEAMRTFKPVFLARFGRREGEPLAAAFEATLAEFKPTTRQPFPIPGDFEKHMPSGRIDMGREHGAKLDLDGRRRRADRLVADWRAGQCGRADKGNPAIRRALENTARPIADAAAWSENPEPLVLTQLQLRTACQAALSQERRTRYGKPPADGHAWWRQISAVADEWGIRIAPDWWDEPTGKALAGRPEPAERAEADVPVEARQAEAQPVGQAKPGGPAYGALLASLAARHRAAGRHEYADRLDREADAQGHYRPMQREEAA